MSTYAVGERKKPKGSLGHRAYMFFWKYRWLHLFALPCVIYVFIFKYVPLYGLLMAFKNYKGYGGLAGIASAPWVGLRHFRTFFTGRFFGRLMRNTLLLSLYQLIFCFPAPILLALLLNEIRSNGFKRVVQTITYMPHFISWVVAAGLVKAILSPTTGPLNAVLHNVFGIEPIYFVNETRCFRAVLIISDIWKEVGWSTIVYLAAITGINPEMYEAATLDGASRWQRMWYITLPSISNMVAIMFILQIGRILDQNFDQIMNLYNPAVYEVGDVIDTYVYRAGMLDGQYSFSTAVGLFKSVVSIIMVFLSNKVAKKLGTSGIW